MKILVVGSGGREHALAWKLSQEAEVIAAPGNPGIAECARCIPIPASDQVAIASVAVSEAVDLAVVGPEDPLIAGLADAIRSKGIPTFGPGAAGAQLEGSKAFSKQLMQESGVVTAAFGVFDDAAKAHEFVSAQSGQLVIKASGAALGKGVLVTGSAEEAHEAVEEILVERTFGEAGREIIIEQRLTGREFSLLTLCSDEKFLSLPVAQDYKRALDGDRGPNTGGMGSVSPVSWVTPEMVSYTEEKVVRPVLAALRERGVSYRGVLYSGLMVQEGVPHCLEFNVRFGDPEIQSLVCRLGAGFAEALLACANGVAIPPIEVLDQVAVSVVVASGGYPNSYEKGKAITISSLPESTQVFHAGTAMKDGVLVTSGGRVAAISASGPDLGTARARAYEGAEAVAFEGRYYRRDIAS